LGPASESKSAGCNIDGTPLELEDGAEDGTAAKSMEAGIAEAFGASSIPPPPVHSVSVEASFEEVPCVSPRISEGGTPSSMPPSSYSRS